METKRRGRSLHLPLWLLLGLTALSLTGCMWMRLLALKNQLAEFDRYVKVEDRDGLKLRLLKPVLHASDVEALLDGEPSSKTTNGNRQTWDWQFEKIAAAGEGDRFDLAFSTDFTDDKLAQVAIPSRFEAIMPKEMVLALVRSLGQAKVNRQKREVTSNWKEGRPGARVAPPSKAQIVQLLGQPGNVTNSPTAVACFYEYRLKPPSPGRSPGMLARVTCKFSRDTESLERVEVVYGTMRVQVAFDAPPSPSGDPKGGGK